MSVRRLPRLWNKYERGVPADAVNIMRGTPWGNPFIIGREGLTREMAVVMYIDTKSKDTGFLLRVRAVLHGRDLVCCCTPKLCHGEWLLKVANRKER